MGLLAVAAVLGLAFIDGRNVLKGRKTEEILGYIFIMTLTLVLVLAEVFFYQPVVLSKVINIVFRPIADPILTFLRQH